MEKLENYGVLEMDAREMVTTDGGGMIADFVNWLKCDCEWPNPYWRSGGGFVY